MTENTVTCHDSPDSQSVMGSSTGWTPGPGENVEKELSYKEQVMLAGI